MLLLLALKLYCIKHAATPGSKVVLHHIKHAATPGFKFKETSTDSTEKCINYLPKKSHAWVTWRGRAPCRREEKRQQYLRVCWPVWVPNLPEGVEKKTTDQCGYLPEGVEKKNHWLVWVPTWRGRQENHWLVWVPTWRCRQENHWLVWVPTWRGRGEKPLTGVGIYLKG